MSMIKLFCFATHSHIHKLFFSNLPQIRIDTAVSSEKMANIRIGYGQSVPGGMSVCLPVFCLGP